METVIKKLSEIEIAAKKIMEAANAQLQDLTQQMQSKTADFNIQTAQNTEQQLARLRQELEEQTNMSLAKMKTDANRISTLMTQYYHDHHDEISDKIYKKIIGM